MCLLSRIQKHEFECTRTVHPENCRQLAGNKASLLSSFGSSLSQKMHTCEAADQSLMNRPGLCFQIRGKPLLLLSAVHFPSRSSAAVTLHPSGSAPAGRRPAPPQTCPQTPSGSSPPGDCRQTQPAEATWEASSHSCGSTNRLSLHYWVHQAVLLCSKEGMQGITLSIRASLLSSRQGSPAAYRPSGLSHLLLCLEGHQCLDHVPHAPEYGGRVHDHHRLKALCVRGGSGD